MAVKMGSTCGHGTAAQGESRAGRVEGPESLMLDRPDRVDWGRLLFAANQEGRRPHAWVRLKRMQPSQQKDKCKE
jgi:hypothetical protein